METEGIFQKIHQLILAFWRRSSPQMTVARMNERFCPYAVGVNNGGIVIPSTTIMVANSMAVTEYLTAATFMNMSGVHFWIQHIHKAGNKNMETVPFLHTINEFAMMSQTIPAIRYQSFPERTTVEQMTIQELVLTYNMTTLSDIALYLYSVVIFGLYLDDGIASDVLKIVNIPQFVTARIFQGELDRALGPLSIAGSSILPFGMLEYREKTYDAGENFLDKVSSAMEGSETEKLHDILRGHIISTHNSTFLGNSTDHVIALQEAGLTRFPSTYQSYLTNRSDFVKVGYTTFENITTGKGPKGITPTRETNNMWEQEDVKRPSSLASHSQPRDSLSNEKLPSYVGQFLGVTSKGIGIAERAMQAYGQYKSFGQATGEMSTFKNTTKTDIPSAMTSMLDISPTQVVKTIAGGAAAGLNQMADEHNQGRAGGLSQFFTGMKGFFSGFKDESDPIDRTGVHSSLIGSPSIHSSRVAPPPPSG